MKKIIMVFVLSTFLTGCKNYFFNKGLEKTGVYNKSIKLTKLQSNSKEVVFFPMRHIGVEEFYNDTEKKIDSLKKIDYYFFLETVNVSLYDTVTLRKFRKIRGIPIPNKGLGYMYLIDSVYKFKLKKKLIDQPKYNTFGIDSFSGKRVDLDLKDIITAYESKYGEIILEACDFETSVNNKSTCNDKKIDKSIIDNLLLTLRNQKIVNEIHLHKGAKIALIYGEEHFVEIKAALLSNGFRLSN